IGEVLDWSPNVLHSNDTIDFFLAEDIKVDVVLSTHASTYKKKQIKNFPIKKEFISDALDYLIQNNYKAVNIVSDILVEALEAYCALINIVVLSHGKRNVYVK